jgi:adenine-specific DNA methylase
MDKKYVSAPLPFQGQKRHHLREFSNIIKTLSPAIVVDLFGGSGLLSHTAKRANPKSRVIYNDYDNYCERLAHVEQTNNLIRYFRELLHDYQSDAKITGSLRETILQKLSDENAKGYVDWITLSASLLFSMNYALNYEGFAKDTMYNKVRMSDYVVDGYLDGLEIVRADYSELCRQYQNEPCTLFIADPPYLSTDVKTYNKVEYWNMNNYLDILTALNGLNYVYFTSNKSQIVELCQWIDDNAGKVANIFKGASITTVKSPTSGKNSYTDIMLYKLDLK